MKNVSGNDYKFNSLGLGMQYFLEIDNKAGYYEGHIHQGDQASAYFLPKLELGPRTEITIKGKSYTLSKLIQSLNVFDERDQLELGRYLYAQTLGQWQGGQHQNVEVDIQLRIITEDEHILRLPWVLLARNGIFLVIAGWSISLSRSGTLIDCELPPSPHLLMVMPQPIDWPDTQAKAHLEDLEEMLSQADHHFYQGRHLQVARTWEEFQSQVTNQHYDLLYYYGHGVGNIHHSRLVFASGKTGKQKEVPVADIAACLRQAPNGPPLLAYVNCCQGDAGGILGAGRQLLDLIPAVVTNRTVAHIDAARPQAMQFWRATLLEGMPPHVAVVGIYSRLADMDLSLKDVRWMTPVLHNRYRNWKANPPRRSQPYRDPHWQLKVDRVSQFSQVAYQTRQMLRERKPRALAYIWYGQKGQGLDLFHQRLKVELRDDISNVRLYEVRPRWPDDLHKPSRSFKDMLLEAFEVISLDDIPGRIRTQTQGESGRQTLVYVRHQPVPLPNDPKKPAIIKPDVLRTYLEWWDCNFVPLLHRETDAFGLLGVSFEVHNPPKFLEVLTKKVDDLEMSHTVLHVLDEMERLAKKDLRDFLKTHNIDLPSNRRERTLDKVLEETRGHYEKTLDALKLLVERAWDPEDEGGKESVAVEDEDY